MTLRYEVTMAGDEGHLVLVKDNHFGSDYAIESVVGCRALVREMFDYAYEYKVEPPLPTTQDAAWELFVETCMAPEKLSKELRTTVQRAYLAPLSATIPRLSAEGTRRVPSRQPFQQRSIIIHDDHRFGLIHSATIASMRSLGEVEADAPTEPITTP